MQRRASVLSSSLLLAGATLVHAQWTGKVILPDQTPVAGVQLVLESNGNTTSTGTDGSFVLDGATGLQRGGATDLSSSMVLQRGNQLVLHLSTSAPVQVALYSLSGKMLGTPYQATMGPGEHSFDLLKHVRMEGVAIVRVTIGSSTRSFRIAFTGNGTGGGLTPLGSTVTGNVLAKEAGSYDAATLIKDGDTLGQVSFYISSGALPDIVVTHRTHSGIVLGNGNTVTSVLIAMSSNLGTTLNLDPDYDPTSGNFSVTEPWILANTSEQWTATLTTTTASQTRTRQRRFAGDANTVDYGTISFTAPASSSSIVISSSSSAMSSSSIVASSSSQTVSSSSQVSSSSIPSSSSLWQPDPPTTLQASIDWVWENRILDPTESNALGFYNYIFDQILAEQGQLYFCVRWESTSSITRTQRDKFEPMLNRAINNWTDWLVGYDGWPYDTIPVHVVGWALPSASQLDQTGITVPVYANGGLEANGASAPKCPDACNRDMFHSVGRVNTTYPNCHSPDQHFDMSLWGTDGFNGGAGGDWGARVGASYILSVLDAKEPHIIEHEFGHGFSLPDFYDANQFPPSGLPAAIMQAGASAVITEWDGWMLRRVWSELKAASGRLQY